jgi:hypothetical protein
MVGVDGEGDCQPDWNGTAFCEIKLNISAKWNK